VTISFQQRVPVLHLSGGTRAGIVVGVGIVVGAGIGMGGAGDQSRVSEIARRASRWLPGIFGAEGSSV